MLEIRNLHASVDGNEILKGINLTINPGEVHAIMGPNGSGKSTLAKVLAGHPQYTVTAGEVIYDGKNLLDMTPDERAREGVFMAFQYPVEVPGVSNARNYTQCDSMLIGSNAGANTFPYIEVMNNSSQVEHEASTSRISEEQLFYLMQRGISQEDAVSLIINGFCKDVFLQLPMEFAVEATRLLGLKLEGSVG